jgi:hypothetical protein
MQYPVLLLLQPYKSQPTSQNHKLEQRDLKPRCALLSLIEASISNYALDLYLHISLNNDPV